ncbi:hypothetical protein [Caulobacter sp. 1776]|uniref:hypothetical protein n=1 Tax=Caulobacter sp. 1776 TaxID=3156420 RepID=UPI00339B680C
MNRLLVPALAPLLLLIACEQKTATPAAPAQPAETRTVAMSVAPTAAEDAVTGFRHDPAVNLEGYYFTETPVQTGNWKLVDLSIRDNAAFDTWEAGHMTDPGGPIFLSFDDVTSPTAENELGQTYHKVNFRLEPAGYRIDGKQLLFRAQDARVGEVVLELTPDLTLLKAARAAGPNGGPPKIVFTGSLQVGAERIRNISFFYHPGE